MCWRQAVVFDLDQPLREPTPMCTDRDRDEIVTAELAGFRHLFTGSRNRAPEGTGQVDA
jgi:hypothetical protein